MKEIFYTLYNDITFMQICFKSYFLFVLFIVVKYLFYDKNIIKIKEVLNKILASKFSRNVKNYVKNIQNETYLFFLIFIKHFKIKKYFIFACIVLILIFSYFSHAEWSKMLIGIFVSALVTFLFLDSIKQYNNEQKFMQISRKIKENIFNCYCSIFHILNCTLSDSENNSFFKDLNMPVSAKNIDILEQNIQNMEIRNNNKLGERDVIVANSYLSQLKNKISKTYDLLNYTSSDLEIYHIAAKLLELLFTLENVGNHYFDIKYDKGMKKIISGLNTSLMRDVLKEYCCLYRIIDNNSVLKNIAISVTIDVGMAVAIQEEDGTIRNAK